MLRFVRGNLFDSKARTLVNTVNCAGIMGKGVALSFKKKYPDMYNDYRRRCEQGEIRPGVLTLYTDTEPWVLNFPTKRHWRARSRLDDIEAGLKEFVCQYKRWGITSVAMPALGCGHGGLDWADDRSLIEKYLGDLEIDIEVYEPGSEIRPSDEDSQAEVGMLQYQIDLFGNTLHPPEPKRKRRRRSG